jgi:hypothetical protein
MHNVVSVDGFIADANDDVGPLHDWYFSGDNPVPEDAGQQYDHSGGGSSIKVSRASAGYVRTMWASIGTIVMGRKARELAGERTVAVNAGDVGSQVFAAGLVDEVAMDVVPAVFGSGKRYFGSIDGQHLLEDPHVVIQGDRVLHLKFKVRR